MNVIINGGNLRGLSGELQLVYVAGFFDGEGCVSISYDARRNRYHITAAITQNNLGILEEINTFFLNVGHLYEKKLTKQYINRQWELVFCGKQANLFLKAIYPYLQVKKEQALVAFKFCATLRTQGRSKHLSEEAKSLRKTLWLYLKQINNGGNRGI